MQPMFTTMPEQDRSGMGFAFMEAFMDSGSGIRAGKRNPGEDEEDRRKGRENMDHTIA